MEFDDLVINDRPMRLREVGGAMKEMWHAYYEKCDGIVVSFKKLTCHQESGDSVLWQYTISASDLEGFGAAVADLWDLLDHPSMARKRVLVVLTDK